MTSPTTAAELTTAFADTLRDDYEVLGADPAVIETRIRELHQLLDVVRAECAIAHGLGPTETWLSTPYPKAMTAREIRIRYRFGSLDDGFVAVAYRNGACYGNPFGYGASIEEACASLMNRLTVEAMTPDDGGKDG